MVNNSNQQNIILVEDNEDDVFFIKRILKDQFQIHWIQSGQQALDFLLHPDRDITLVLMDYNLPELDGISVIEQCIENNKHYAFILLTGDESVETAVKALKSGALDYVSKMKGFKSLPEIITKVLELYSQKKDLIESKQKVSDILKSINDGFFALNHNWVYTYVNENAAIMFQQDSKNLVGKNIWEEFPDLIGTETHQIMHEVMKKKIEHHFQTYFNKMDSWFEMSVYPYSDGISVFFQEITQRIKQEEQLRKLNRAVEQSANSIVITDSRGTIEYVNPKFVELTGYRLDEIYGKNPRILKSGERTESDYKNLWATITSGNEWSGEFHNKKKNGELYWELASISPIRDDNGKITHFIAVKEDITERKKVEAQLNEYKDHLEELVINRTKELEQTTEKLKNANLKLQGIVEREQELSQMKDEFTSNVNHELRTPLTSLLMTTKYLLKRIERLSTEDIKQRLERIQLSGENLLNLVNELLDFSKIEAGQFQCHLTEFTMNLLLDEIKSSFEELFLSKNLRFIINIETDIYIFNDYEHIRKIISNLVNNAFKFTDEGFVQIHCSTLDEWVKIVVSDTGCGIKTDQINEIFERFKQGKIHNNKAPGTGIGLHIVKQLTEKHGGNLEVQSVIDKGSDFIISLPKRSKWFNKESEYLVKK